MAVKRSTAAVLQLRNGWCLEKVSILAAYKENKALECFRGAAVWKHKLLFSHHSLLPMIQHSKPASEYLPVTNYANMHRHIYSREYIGLIRKEMYIHFVFQEIGEQAGDPQVLLLLKFSIEALTSRTKSFARQIYQQQELSA